MSFRRTARCTTIACVVGSHARAVHAIDPAQGQRHRARRRDASELQVVHDSFEDSTRARELFRLRRCFRLLYEATRDAGLWNLHWTITDRPPNSDNIWRQWHAMGQPSALSPTASAECDELSALFAFLARRSGVKGVGLFWPYPNHTVAVWELHPAERPTIRVVVPTSQIFSQPARARYPQVQRVQPEVDLRVHASGHSRCVRAAWAADRFLSFAGRQVCERVGRHASAIAISTRERLPEAPHV